SACGWSRLPSGHDIREQERTAGIPHPAYHQQRSYQSCQVIPLRNVFLVGPMGAGKSTIGRLLAKELGYPFMDSNRRIEARTGADIPWIFDVEREDGFREREEAMIVELVQEQVIVLTTGCGVVMRESNLCAQGENGLVVYLRTSVEQQLQRTAKDR